MKLDNLHFIVYCVRNYDSMCIQTVSMCTSIRERSIKTEFGRKSEYLIIRNQFIILR